MKIFIDTIFPPSRDMLLVRHAPPRALLLSMRPTRMHAVESLLPFSDPLVRACLHEAKFHDNTKATEMLGYVLLQFLETLPIRETIIIPIPLSRARMRERGYNQVTQVITKALQCGTLPHMTLREDVLERIKNTTPQTSLPKEARVGNVADAFGVRYSDALSGAHVILIDDVMTTGSTMHAAKAALLPHTPATLTCFTLAH